MQLLDHPILDHLLPIFLGTDDRLDASTVVWHVPILVRRKQHEVLEPRHSFIRGELEDLALLVHFLIGEIELVDGGRTAKCLNEPHTDLVHLDVMLQRPEVRHREREEPVHLVL